MKQQRLASARKRWPEHIRDEEKLHWWDTTDRQGIMQVRGLGTSAAHAPCKRLKDASRRRKHAAPQGAETATGTNRGEEVPPWTLGFQMSER